LRAAAPALVACLLAAPARPAVAGESTESGDVVYAMQRIDVEGRLLDVRFVDMDGDGRKDLVVAVRAQRPGLAPRRELRLHPMAADGTLATEPSLVLPVPDDVIVYGCADVGPDAGRELILMTRSGVHSFSPRASGLRAGRRRLVTTELLFQVPSTRHLPSWSYVIERQGAPDLLVLDGTTGQNAIRQASEFARSAPVSGLILAKMDGTAKGGAVFGIRDVLPVPVKFLGVGEGIGDLEPFRAEAYVDAILDFGTGVRA
jgi:hypothetical protein